MIGNAKGNRLLGFYTFVYLLVLYAPIAFIPLFSFNASPNIAFPISGFSLDWYRRMADSTGLLEALENSLMVGISVAVVSTLFGTLAAKAFTRYKLPFAASLKGFISIPLVIPLIILGIALMVMMDQIGIPLSLFTISLGHVVICVPFSMMIMMSRLEGFDASLEESAQDLGETPWMTFWRVTFPIALPGIVSSLLLTFTISFDEFLLALFLSGDQATLPVYIWSQLRFPQRLPSVLALGSCILLVSAILVIAAEVIQRRAAQQ